MEINDEIDEKKINERRRKEEKEESQVFRTVNYVIIICPLMSIEILHGQI